jgi:hypothetical protein
MSLLGNKISNSSGSGIDPRETVHPGNKKNAFMQAKKSAHKTQPSKLKESEIGLKSAISKCKQNYTKFLQFLSNSEFIHLYRKLSKMHNYCVK